MSVTITGAAITGNTATSHGGGISIGWGSKVVLQNSTLTGNTAVLDGGGGIYLYDQASVTVTASALTGNTSEHWGGGILTRGTVILNSGSTVTGNTAADTGGGIAVFGDGTWTAEDKSSVSGNTAPGEADVYSEW
jgi:parallel beta-helix repeat protein